MFVKTVQVCRPHPRTSDIEDAMHECGVALNETREWIVLGGVTSPCLWGDRTGDRAAAAALLK